MTVEVEAEGEKEHCELAKPLAELLGIRHESRANILQALFTYIRLHKLQVGLLLHTTAVVLSVHDALGVCISVLYTCSARLFVREYCSTALW